MVGQNILEHPRSNEWNVLAPSSIELDLFNWADVCSYLEQEKPNIIIHAAALAGGIQANIKNPVAYMDNNVLMGRNIIMAAYQSGVKHLINISSTCMYPRLARNPLTESMILSGELEPTNEGYALAKIMTTRLCQYIQKENPHCAYKSLIACNLYGRHDKFGKKNSHLVAAVINKIHRAKVNGEKTVGAWGDGNARREFMYAGDFADAVLKAASEIHHLPDIMNIAYGRDYTVDDYYNVVASVIGWNGKLVHDESKPSGMQQKLASIKLQTAWGWQPKTKLTNGIKNTYEFYLKYCCDN